MDLNDIEVLKMLEIPFQDRQGTNYTCGADSVQKVLVYYGEDYREMNLAEILKSDPENGTLVKNIVDFFHSKGFKAVVKEKMTIKDLIKHIDRNIPVIIMIQAWGDTGKDYSKDWDDGHYVVVMGYTKDKLIIADPALFTLGYIPKKELVKRWHDVDGDKKTYQLGISVFGKKPKFDMDKIEKIK